ncbi:MAG: pitrilysin family protein [Candidatus Falkowbacteria bacterium]|nr:pitrilysin family protein [Candidatus Falkowbacteria bacterium]
MTKLQNLYRGLKLLTVPMKNTNTLTTLVIVGTGSKYENKTNNGISHFLEHLFFKGTRKRPSALAISSELDSLGAEFNAFTAKEYTGFWVKSRKKNLGEVLDIISDILMNSKFATEEIERERGVITEEINMYFDNPLMYIEDVFETCLYGDTPAGWDTIGTKDNIAKLKREDFINYLQAQYGSGNTIVCLVGNLGAGEKQIAKLINKYFGRGNFLKWGQSFKEKQPVEEKQSAPQIRINFKETDQTHLSLGFRTFGYYHEEKNIVKLMSIILGGSMSSRMFIRLRERAGLGYYVHTNSEFYTDTGYLTTRASVKTGAIKKALHIILQEYKKMAQVLVDKQELQRTKDLLCGRLVLQLETSDNLAEWYGRQAILSHALARTISTKEKILSPQEYLTKINKITATDIRRLSQQIFVKQGLNIAIIGPFKDKKRFEKILKI